MHKRQKGAWGESQACQYLTANGYVILARNYQIRTGEIDIVAEKDQQLHFVEVKLRRSGDYGTPAEAVNKAKLLKIRRTALHFLSCHQLTARSYMIDVIEVAADEEPVTVNHLINVTA